jgi:beta-phosphoglucomutase-like phosphatase (HAD superfamily)
MLAATTKLESRADIFAIHRVEVDDAIVGVDVCARRERPEPDTFARAAEQRGDRPRRLVGFPSDLVIARARHCVDRRSEAE